MNDKIQPPNRDSCKIQNYLQLNRIVNGFIKGDLTAAEAVDSYYEFATIEYYDGNVPTNHNYRISLQLVETITAIIDIDKMEIYDTMFENSSPDIALQKIEQISLRIFDTARTQLTIPNCSVEMISRYKYCFCTMYFILVIYYNSEIDFKNHSFSYPASEEMYKLRKYINEKIQLPQRYKKYTNIPKVFELLGGVSTEIKNMTKDDVKMIYIIDIYEKLVKFMNIYDIRSKGRY